MRQLYKCWLAEHLQSGQKSPDGTRTTLGSFTSKQARTQAETTVAQAAASFPFGRQGRVREALAYTFRTAQELADARLASAYTTRRAVGLA